MNRIASLAALAMIAAAIATPSHAFLAENGVKPNGVKDNGVSVTGQDARYALPVSGITLPSGHALNAE
jgi:hypothetical protein